MSHSPASAEVEPRGGAGAAEDDDDDDDEDDDEEDEDEEDDEAGVGRRDVRECGGEAPAEAGSGGDSWANSTCKFLCRVMWSLYFL